MTGAVESDAAEGVCWPMSVRSLAALTTQSQSVALVPRESFQSVLPCLPGFFMRVTFSKPLASPHTASKVAGLLGAPSTSMTVTLLRSLALAFVKPASCLTKAKTSFPL